MKYSKQEVLQFVKEEDVKFIRLAFCDVFGTQKNISIMEKELQRAFEYGIAIDASAIKGFGDESHSDLFLHPDPSTLVVLPWRPEHGKVVRMYCEITYPDGKPFEGDTRSILKNAIQKAEDEGLSFKFGPEMEFYLFKLNENGYPSTITYDNAGYMDIAPEDKGENIRREICLTLEQMDIYPESSHHEEGPGQNEIDFKYDSPLEAADNAMTFCSVVKAVVNRNGVSADFSPKPLKDEPGNGFHINFSIKNRNGFDVLPHAIAGILKNISDMTLFLNPTEKSYERLGNNKAPAYISWSAQNRSQLIRIPAAEGEFKRAELRSPDPTANPYLAFALIIYAAIEGIKKNSTLPKPANINFYTTSKTTLQKFKTLPSSLTQAAEIAKNSKFIKKYLSPLIISAYCNAEK